MKVFRIERAKYVKDALKGLGAASSDGMRWNSQYTRMVYTAESRALALLEVALHLDLIEDLPNDRWYLEIEIPDDVHIHELSKKQLSKNWNVHPPGRQTQHIGDAFVAEGHAAVLKVPSTVVPDEFNYLINPLHPDAKKIKIRGKKLVVFDERIKKPLSK